jgi:hypothetical protein
VLVEQANPTVGPHIEVFVDFVGKSFRHPMRFPA